MSWKGITLSKAFLILVDHNISKQLIQYKTNMETLIIGTLVTLVLILSILVLTLKFVIKDLEKELDEVEEHETYMLERSLEKEKILHLYRMETGLIARRVEKKEYELIKIKK